MAPGRQKVKRIAIYFFLNNGLWRHQKVGVSNLLIFQYIKYR